MIFADDTQIYLSIPSAQFNERLSKIAHDVSVISDYATKNGLNLNVGKSKILIFGSNAYVNQINYYDLPCIFVNGINLPYVSKERNLRVCMMSNLSWSRHVSCISRKVHGTLHALKYHKDSLLEEMRLKLVTALLLPHIDYCCSVYHGLIDGLDKKLQKLVNLEIRFIYNSKRGEHIAPFR